MKTSSKITVIASLAALALVGSAFAAWQFNKAATKTVESNVAITKDDSVGEITLSKETFYLTLDQDVLAWTESDHTDDVGAIEDTLTSIKVTYTGSSKANDVSDVTLTASFTADTAFASYVSITGGSLAEPTATGNKKEADYTLPTLAWTAQPTTQAQFNAMKEALAGKKVTFTFKATIAA